MSRPVGAPPWCDGTDGAHGTGDDELFETFEELDGIVYVGRSALEKLRAYAAALP